MSLLLDTIVLVDLLRQVQPAIDLIKGLRSKPSISVVTVTELFAGANSITQERRIEQLAQASHVLAVTIDIARSAGQHIKHYQSSHGLDDFDALIAATAEHHGIALATLNVKHFPMFPELKPAY